VALGNVLADYIDGGGRLVISTYAMTPPNWQIAGRIITPGYSPLVATSAGDVSGNLSILIPGDPAFTGINFAAITYFHNSGFAVPTLTSGSTLLATDGAGTNMIARNSTGNIIAANLFPSSPGCHPANSSELYNLFAQMLVSLSSVPRTSVATPTMTEWGMILLVSLLGIGSIYYLKRSRVAG
jgi:hypothetical protein